MTIAGLLGRKIGMTTYYHEDGTAESVTAVEVGPCVVTQVKTEARDGYEAVQLGFGSARRLNSPEAGHQNRSGRRFTHLQEFGVDDLSEFEVGQEIKADVFEVGEPIKVIGTSKGKGFSGVVRRWGFRGGPKTHGQSDRHRSPGSIGAGLVYEFFLRRGDYAKNAISNKMMVIGSMLSGAAESAIVTAGLFAIGFSFSELLVLTTSTGFPNFGILGIWIFSLSKNILMSTLGAFVAIGFIKSKLSQLR